MKNLLLALIILAICSFNYSIAGNITGKVTRNSKGVVNAVVYVDVSGSTSSKHVKMNQKKLTFAPHVLPVLAGTTVDFLNGDDVLHNVYSPDGCCDNFNLGSYPKGESNSYTFNNAGCVASILCNVHPEMSAYVVVLGSPYFALTSGGNYKIKNVPGGSYTIKVWHEKYGTTSVSVDVPESGDVTLNIEL